MPLHDSFQKKNPTQTNLVLMSTLPSAEDLAYGLATAQKSPRRPYMLAWQQAGDVRVLSITWGLEPAAEGATWVLRNGEGPNSTLLWKHQCGDAYLMHNLIAEELANKAPTAVIPDFLRPQAPPVTPDPEAQPPSPVAERVARQMRTEDFDKEAAVGSVFDERYEMLAEVGRGAMGIVYKAKQRVMNRFVAIKILHHHLLTPENWKRLEQEARSSSTLSHPNLIVVHDFGKSPLGRPYMVMDYACGPNLQELLNQNGLLTLELFAEIFSQCCGGVGHAHKKGVVHRDMKPSNLIVTETDEGFAVKVLDFGIAKMASEPSDQGLTRQGMVLGSPLYMSPEQCRNEDLDGRSDLYSIGVMMFQSMTGTLPFIGKDAFETLYKHVHEAPPLMATVRPDLTFWPEVQKIISKALEKDLDHRYQTAEEMVSDLQTLKNVRWSGQGTQQAAPSRPSLPPTGGQPTDIAGHPAAADWGHVARQPTEWSNEPAQPKPPSSPLNAAHILQQAGLINTQDMQQAKAVVDHVGGDIAAILVATGKLDRVMLDAARKCKSSMENGQMNLSQSCVVLNYCFRARCNYEAALEELGMR